MFVTDGGDLRCSAREKRMSKTAKQVGSYQLLHTIGKGSYGKVKYAVKIGAAALSTPSSTSTTSTTSAAPHAASVTETAASCDASSTASASTAPSSSSEAAAPVAVAVKILDKVCLHSPHFV